MLSWHFAKHVQYWWGMFSKFMIAIYKGYVIKIQKLSEHPTRVMAGNKSYITDNSNLVWATIKVDL